MGDTAKRLAGPVDLTTGEVTYYTVPASTTTVVRSVHLANSTGGAVAVKVSIGADAVGTRLLGDVSVPANGVFDVDGFIVLEAGETLRASAASGSAVALTVSGVEVA